MRVIVRRPHAYFFIQDLFEDKGGIQSATPAGCKLADGRIAPLPGLYFLDSSGDHLGHIALNGTDARGVVKAIEEAGSK